MAWHKTIWLTAAALAVTGCVATGDPAYSSEDAEQAEKLRDDYTDPDLTVSGRNEDYQATRLPKSEDDSE